MIPCADTLRNHLRRRGPNVARLTSRAKSVTSCFMSRKSTIALGFGLALATLAITLHTTYAKSPAVKPATGLSVAEPTPTIPPMTPIPTPTTPPGTLPKSN
jgi:hypothetical protein